MDGHLGADLVLRTRDVLRDAYLVDDGLLHAHEGSLFRSAIAHALHVAGNEFDAASKFMSDLFQKSERGLIAESPSIAAAPMVAIKLHRKMERIDLFDPQWIAALEAGRSTTISA